MIATFFAYAISEIITGAWHTSTNYTFPPFRFIFMQAKCLTVEMQNLQTPQKI